MVRLLTEVQQLLHRGKVTGWSQQSPPQQSQLLQQRPEGPTTADEAAAEFSLNFLAAKVALS